MLILFFNHDLFKKGNIEMAKATGKIMPQKNNRSADLCVCGCGRKTGPTSFYARTPDGYVLSRSCLDVYKASHGSVYTATNPAHAS